MFTYTTVYNQIKNNSLWRGVDNFDSTATNMTFTGIILTSTTLTVQKHLSLRTHISL